MNIIGQFFGSSGYSNHTRYLASELNKLVNCTLMTNLIPGFEKFVTDDELKMIKREADYNINLIITHPVNWKSHLTAKRNFVYLIWEGDIVPEWILEECKNPKIEKIIVPSNHTYDALIKGAITFGTESDDLLLTTKTHIIPHGVDLETFYPKEIKHERFTFLMNKGLRNLEDRGGLQYGIKAYLEEFSSKDNTELIVKINPAYGIPNLKQMFPQLDTQVNLPKIRFIVKDMKSSELNDLYNECDVFISPTRGEAFNLPCLEAMSCNKPVITTNFGGQTDFIDSSVGSLINYELSEVKHEVEYEGVSWAIPDNEHLKHIMRNYYNKRDKNKNCRKRALDYTWESTAKQIHNLFK